MTGFPNWDVMKVWSETNRSKYYYKSFCSRICEISLYFSNLKSLVVKVSRVSAATFPGPYGMPTFIKNSDQGGLTGGISDTGSWVGGLLGPLIFFWTSIKYYILGCI